MNASPEQDLLRAILETPEWSNHSEQIQSAASRKLRRRRTWRATRPILALVLFAGCVLPFSTNPQETLVQERKFTLWTDADRIINPSDEVRFPL